MLSANFKQKLRFPCESTAFLFVFFASHPGCAHVSTPRPMATRYMFAADSILSSFKFAWWAAKTNV